MGQRAEKLLDWMEHRTTEVRVVLATLAIFLLVVGWCIGPFVTESNWAWVARNHPNFQRLASIPAAILALFEAVRSQLEKRHDTRDKDVHALFDEVMVELEDTCARMTIPSRTYHCGISVWKVQPLSETDEKAGEKRRPLKRIARRPVRYKQSSSGLLWREGMGVIGMALTQNAKLAIDVDAAWRPLRGCDEKTWDAAPEHVRQGLTHEQFLRAVAGSTIDDDEPAAPFVLAVPVWKEAEPVGVVALDTPSAMGPAARDPRVKDLLSAVGTYVLDP
jgi:hypothetical protein